VAPWAAKPSFDGDIVMNYFYKPINVFTAIALIVMASAVWAKNPDSVFIGGTTYKHKFITNAVPTNITSNPSTIVVVAKSSIPTIAAKYDECAKSAGYAGQTQSYTTLNSSHFSNMHLVQSEGMSVAQFNNAVACAKGVTAPRTATAGSAAPNSRVGYIASNASFAVPEVSLAKAQKAYAKCTRSSGYRDQAQLKVERYDSSINKISLVRSAGMTPAQYNKAVSCMAAKVDGL
jgi:hypothetical protein